ncbi:Bacterial type II secretion system protein I/J [Marinomonas gallaica]|uniref:Type II secretion system protein I n=1 Tax=Marinomonas gallaica TaxID=1806667 RepID=A0A1C3JN13_9GAMM|nr:type II secretion system minor pseudopilin GspI [Marinomonas gallaica]SBT16546.1 Bacterial type II secretion system protein I/J [Marinomonas gallaica]SBT20262.1 Bacterial type II secretion system protein I/J [Marinomonas gallaica]
MFFRWSKVTGFTLIEVLVALVILASVGVVLMQTSVTGTKQSDYLTEKILAAWVAEDRATELRLAVRLGQPLELGDAWIEQGTLRFRTRVLKIEQTEFLQTIEVSVFYPSDVDQPLYRLESFLPREASIL